jgi:hypothetical protein
MKAIEKEIAELKAHNNFVQVYLLDRYKDDLSGLANHIYGQVVWATRLEAQSEACSIT